MSNPPIPYDSLFKKPSLSAEDEDTLVPPVDYGALFGGPPAPHVSAETLIQSVRDAAAVAPPQAGVQFDDSLFKPKVPRLEPPKLEPPPLPDVTAARDVTAMQTTLKPGERPGEGRRARLERQQKEYEALPLSFHLSQLKNEATIGPQPTGFARIQQRIASTRVFTGQSLIEFDIGNSSGFHIGTPFAHPVETAKQMIVGLPRFFANLVTQPAELMIDKIESGGHLLPEEKKQIQKEVIANYAGLFMGAAVGSVSRSMRVGSEALRAGVAASERAGVAASAAELNALRQTLPRALQVENSILQKMITGVHEGAAGGLTSGLILERDAAAEGRLNQSLAYAIQAAPFGIAFEAVRPIFRRKQTLGPLAQAAIEAQDLFMIRTMQASEKRTLRQNAESYFNLATSDDLAQAAMRSSRELGGVVIPGVREQILPRPTEAIDPIYHRRPDGLYDIAIGIPEEIGVSHRGLGDQPVGEGLSETITEAAMRDPTTGRHFTGVNHPDAQDAMAAAIPERTLPPERGYVTQSGRFVTEPEAIRMTNDPGFSSKRIVEQKAFDQIAEEVPSVTIQQARAMFEVGGFFPNQSVSFLGRAYTYERPIIGKSGALEGHVIKYADGSEFEVPWNQLRRGPDVLINNYEVSKPMVQRAIFNDFKKVMREMSGEDIPNVPFKDMVDRYVAARHLTPGEVAPITNFLGERLAEQMRNDHLTPQEHALYKRMVAESKRYPTEIAHQLADVASSNGMLVERLNGNLLITDGATGEMLGLFRSPEAAKQFINTSGQDYGADLTPGGPTPPDAINRGLMAVPPPPNGPHMAPFNFLKDGPLAQFNNWFNTTLFGTRFTGMQQIMKSLDSQFRGTLDTEFYARVADPLQVAFKKKAAAIRKDLQEASVTAKMSRGLTPDELDQITTSVHTLSPEDMVQPGGLFNRGFTNHEMTTAQWLVNHEIDTGKAYKYMVAAAKLEARRGITLQERGELLKKLQINLNVDEAHIEAARIISEIQKANKPGEISSYGIIRLADAIMGDDVSPDAYMQTTNFSPQMRAVRERLVAQKKSLDARFDLPDDQKLGGYFAHLRKFKADEIFTTPEGAQAFTTDMLESGDLAAFDRDPINMLVRQINLGHNNRYTRTAVNKALQYIDETVERLPAGRQFVRDLLTKYYVNELRGIPHDEAKFAQQMFEGISQRTGLNLSVDVRRDVVNTALSLSSSAMIGGRVSLAVRDLNSLSSIFFTRFGPGRTADLFTMISRVTPEELVQAGFLKEFLPDEGVTEAMAREGLTPRMGVISVLTPEERLSNTISARTQPFREATQKIGELGIKWGGQYNVYQWAQAAVMLESTTRTLKELNKLATGQYGVGEVAKTKAYDNLFMNSYDAPVVKEFDNLVTAGKFKEASEFLARATAFETVGTFGLANHAAGWGSTPGRIFGQYGNWPIWARSQLARLATRGTPRERTGVAVRFGLTQGALALTSAALGLNLNSWYLPGALPIVEAGRHLGTAFEEYDEERTKALQRAAAMIALGVPGSLAFGGGPAFDVVQTAIETGRGSPRGADEAVRIGGSIPSMLTPGAFLLRDILRGVAMAQNGDNPVSAWLQAFGVRSTEEPSLLNEQGATRPTVSDLEF